MGKDEGRPHYSLEAWKEAVALVKTVYQVTQTFPKDEMFGLIDNCQDIVHKKNCHDIVQSQL